MTRGEALRKAVHIGCGGFALLLRWLPPWGAWMLAASALAFNLFLLPSLTHHTLEREAEKQRGRAWGIIFYPLSVLILTVLFSTRLEIAAAAWGVMAFGDGCATVIGRLVPRPRLPWNRSKSLAGTAAFVVVGTTAAWGLYLFVAPGQGRHPDTLSVLWMAAGAAAMAAVFESLASGLDDNLSAPFAAALFLCGFTLIEPARLLSGPLTDPARLGAALAVNLVLGGAAWLARTVSSSGVIAGVVLGSLIYACAGPAGFALLLAFFVLGSAATRVGYGEKHAAGIAQERGGRRSARHALANGGVGAVLAFFAATTPYSDLLLVAFTAAFCTAAFDTVASEIGQVYGRHPVLVTTLRPVPRGTDGAVSLEGTLAGFLAACVIAVMAWAVGLIPAAAAGPVLAGAFVGAVGESVLGATLESMKVLDNEMVNFLNTVAGAGVALALAGVLL